MTSAGFSPGTMTTSLSKVLVGIISKSMTWNFPRCTFFVSLIYPMKEAMRESDFALDSME